MPIYDDIRETLQTALNSISGLPDYLIENTDQEADPERTHVEDELFITFRRPAVRGPNPQMLYRGLYRITICVPKRSGTGAAMRLAETITAAFDGSTDIAGPNKIVSIDYCETAESFYRETHFCLPVDVVWYIYDT